MTAPRNAAIWFSADGYRPEAKGMNGRRMAGESFLRGWFRHAGVPEYVSLTHGTSEAGLFRELAEESGVTAPVRPVYLDAPARMAPLGTIWYSGPNFAVEAWRRAVHGAASWSVCGLTHTMSTKAVMQGVLDLRCAPSMEWDAVVCTSNAARKAMDYHLDAVDAYLATRFAGKVPPRFQMPVIPLGIDCDEFAPDPAAGRALRDRLGIADQDAVALVVARLTPHEKFDPLPVYIALAEAQKAMPAGRRLHFILFGKLPDSYARRIFHEGAQRLMPDVGCHFLTDEDAARLAAFSAADFFLFAIDNLQETFGLAPVEAMAAGLPVIASDWDGIRDTVDGDAGIRIPTLAGRAEHGALQGMRHFGGTDSYIQYLSQMSAMTRIDVPRLSQAILAVATDEDRRRRMGQAAKARARALFDWAVVVPQLQEVFAELTAIRARAKAADHPPIPPALLPPAPAPMALFGSFPTELIARDDRRWYPVPPEGRLSVEETLALRNYTGTNRTFASEADIRAVHQALDAAGAGGATVDDLATATGLHPLRVERILLWLLKYHFAGDEA